MIILVEQDPFDGLQALHTASFPSPDVLPAPDTTCVIIVPLLWREEGYIVKYSLSPRKIRRVERKGFSDSSGYISHFSIPNNDLLSFNSFNIT